MGKSRVRKSTMIVEEDVSFWFLPGGLQRFVPAAAFGATIDGS